MHSLVKELMTTPVVTVEPTTPFKEIVARLAQHRVSSAGRDLSGQVERN